MASESSPPEEVTVTKTRREREVRRKVDEFEAVNIEELTSYGHRALQTGQTEEGLKCFQKALKVAERVAYFPACSALPPQLQDCRLLRVCFFNLGAAYVEAGKPQKGLDLLRRAQPGPRADRLPDLQFNLALAHNALGQVRQAAAYFLQAAQLYRSQGDGASEGDACMEMSHCYAKLQDWSQAIQGFLRAGESYRVAALLESAAIALKEAGSHMVQSDCFGHDDIISVLTQCLSLTATITDPSILGELYLSLGVSYCHVRCFQEAVQCFQQALTPAAHQPPLLAAVLHNLGAALNSLGQYRSAVGYHRLAAGLYGSLGCRGDQARCFSNLAFANSQLGDEEEAAESFVHALQAFRDTEDHRAQVQVCESLAECYLKQRRLQKAVQLYKQALTALTHCQECSDSVRDRLVERLTAALQGRVQRPRLLRPHPLWSNPDSPSSGQPGRKTDTARVQSPSRDFIHQPLSANRMRMGEEGSEWRRNREEEEAEEKGGRGAEREAAGPQDGAEDCGSAEGGTTEQPEYISMITGNKSSQQPADCQHNGLTHTDSEASLAQETETPPTREDKRNTSTPPFTRWCSRFCSVM